MGLASVALTTVLVLFVFDRTHFKVLNARDSIGIFNDVEVQSLIERENEGDEKGEMV